jgi:DNA-binding SARP family transcriptional activator
MSAKAPRQTGLVIRTLGPMQIERDGESVPVPASRKARAILGYLILAPRPVGRQRLCDMFFDIPDDPRASLRWILTKLRGAVDDPEAARIVATRDAAKFEAVGACVDVLEVLRGGGEDPPESPGLFLEDCELPDRQEFSVWLHSTREDIRTASIQKLRGALEASAISAARRLALHRRLLALDPLDEAANAGLVRTLAQMGRNADAREAANDAERVFQRAGLKAGPALRSGLKAAEASAPEPVVALANLEKSKQLFEELPGVAIVPFQNYSPDIVPDMQADGLLESAIHMLSRFKSFRVSSIDTVLSFKGRIHDPAAIRAATRADFIVGGSIMARGNNVKVRYRVIDAASGSLICSGDIDGVAETGAEMVEEIPEGLVSHLIHQIHEFARDRAVAMPEEKRTAMEHFLAGMSYGFLNPPLDYKKGLECFNAALAIRPDFAAALAGAAWSKALIGVAISEAGRLEAIAQAQKAITLGYDDANVLSIGAWSIVQLRGDVAAARRAIDMAVRVNPLARAAWNISAWTRMIAGEFDTPMEHWRRAEKCSPLGATADQINSGRSLCCWMAGRLDEAADWAQRSLSRAPNNPAALTVALAVAGEKNDVALARETSRLMLSYYPGGMKNPVLSAMPIIDPKERERILSLAAKGAALAS